MAPSRRLVGAEMTKVGPKEAQRAALREKAAATQKRPVRRVKPSVGGKLRPKASEAHPVAAMYAPAGACDYCDRRREMSRTMMQRLRKSRAETRK